MPRERVSTTPQTPTAIQKNRLGTAIGAVSPRIEAHIAWLEQELSDLAGLSAFQAA